MMASRILTRQRTLAESGRLRLGTFEVGTNGKGRPKASHHWVITSHWEEYVQKAAELWGGTAEPYQPQGHGARQFRVVTETRSIDAILPPFEPLMQANERWAAGGCNRRCDGATEQFSGSPCLCQAEWGDNWHERPKGTVCDPKSRLKVMLPDMPGMGSWRLETNSFYAAQELAGIVDGIRIALGPNVLVPVRLRIEQRTRTFDNQTKQFIVPVLDLRDITAGELLSGHYRGMGSLESNERKALPSTSEPQTVDYVAAALEAGTAEAVHEIWKMAKADGNLTAELSQRLYDIGQTFNTPADDGPEEDPDVVWNEVMAAGGALGMDTQQILDDFPKRSGGVMASDASGADMRRYIAALKTEGVGK